MNMTRTQIDTSLNGFSRNPWTETGIYAMTIKKRRFINAHHILFESSCVLITKNNVLSFLAPKSPWSILPHGTDAPESASKYRSGAIRSRFWTQAANEWRMFWNSNDFLWLEIHCCENVMYIRGRTQRTLFTGCHVLELLFPFEPFIPNRNPITWKPMEWLSSPIINSSNFMNFAQNWKNKFH